MCDGVQPEKLRRFRCSSPNFHFGILLLLVDLLASNVKAALLRLQIPKIAL
jgi:hypothetical protein